MLVGLASSACCSSIPSSSRYSSGANPILFESFSLALHQPSSSNAALFSTISRMSPSLNGSSSSLSSSGSKSSNALASISFFFGLGGAFRRTTEAGRAVGNGYAAAAGAAFGEHGGGETTGEVDCDEIGGLDISEELVG